MAHIELTPRSGLPRRMSSVQGTHLSEKRLWHFNETRVQRPCWASTVQLRPELMSPKAVSQLGVEHPVRLTTSQLSPAQPISYCTYSTVHPYIRTKSKVSLGCRESPTAMHTSKSFYVCPHRSPEVSLTARPKLFLFLQAGLWRLRPIKKSSSPH